VPEPNTRIVVLGTPRADKEFDVYVGDRDRAQRDIERGDRELADVERDLQRAMREAARDVRRGRGS
jgi:hypothetical protein